MGKIGEDKMDCMQGNFKNVGWTFVQDYLNLYKSVIKNKRLLLCHFEVWSSQ